MATLPPLITEEGLVLNNMMPNQGALGGYTPLGTASSEGISLLLRGMARAAIVTGDSTKTDFCHFLFDAACTHFFKGVRPTDSSEQEWNHSWICNGGTAFSVRGPLQASGDLALSGYLFGRDPESSVVFTEGVGQMNPPPQIVYQVVSSDSEFVWKNVFSELTVGQQYSVNYYIDAEGNKVFGTQKGGSFGQPSIPAGQHNSGSPGKIVLTAPVSGTFGVNYCTSVVDVKVPYGDLYEAWPMWRKLADNEVSTAADAIHWFLDAFALGKELEPGNLEWSYAFDRMMDIWETTCKQESNSTIIFKAGPSGPYNNFPLTYSYGYGRNNIDNPSTDWEEVPPSGRYLAERTSDGYVTFTMPASFSEIGSGGPIRYGVAFENNPVYLQYTAASQFQLDMRSSEIQTVNVTFTDSLGVDYGSTVMVGPTTTTQLIGFGEFFQYQQEPGDATGEISGDWSDTGGVEEPIPTYPAVAFPGRRLAMVGDSITNYNTGYVSPNASNLYESWGTGVCGFWTHADQILDGRLSFEPGVTSDVQGQKHGLNFALAGSKVKNWWSQADVPMENGPTYQGPMYAALGNLTRFDVVLMMGGTNDLAANEKASATLYRIKKAATDLARQGKWVFLMTITPRTRDLLSGYPISEMDVIRDRLVTVNQGLRDWVASGTHPNIWLVDSYDKLVGPNGVDPFGLASNDENPLGSSTQGNWSTAYPNQLAMHDGLHPSPHGAYVIGKDLANAMIMAGVPARPSRTQLGAITLGSNLLTNPSMMNTIYKATATVPVTFNLSSIGYATGLGDRRILSGNHVGYTYGSLPNTWNLWKSSNQEDQVMGVGVGGNYSNFMEYTLEDLAVDFPKLTEYMSDSTYPVGAMSVSIVLDEGVPAIKIDLNLPVTGNKNEAFVVVSPIPRDQHGPWDNWGYDSPDFGSPRTNTMFNLGDTLVAEGDVKLSGLVGKMVSCNLNLSLYANVATVDYGSVRQGYANQLVFWPPSDMDNIRFPTENRTLHLRAPAITVPAYTPDKNLRYSDFKFQFSFDCSVSGVTGSIILKNPSVRKVVSTLPL